MGKTNRLSRQLDWKVEVDKDNEIYSLQEVIIEEPEVEILEKIKKARSKNEDVVRVVEKVKKLRENE